MMQLRDRPSYYIEAAGYSEEALRVGFGWLLQVSEGRDAVLALPAKGNIANAVADVFGERGARALQKQEQLVVNDTRIRLLTERGWGPVLRGATLVVWPTKKLLDKVDGNRELTPVCIIPWTEHDTTDWLRAWNPAKLTAHGIKEPEKRPSVSPLVGEALGSLSANPSTGLSHPSDKSSAVHVFRILKRHRVPFDPDEVRAHLLTQGWPPSGADQARDIALKVIEGRIIRGVGERPFVPNIMDVWKEQAARAQE